MKKIWTILLLALALEACNKHAEPYIKPPVKEDQITETITLDTEHPANTVPPNFEGLSFETSLLSSNPDHLSGDNTVLIQMLKNLGPGIIRIGGYSSDITYWTGTPRRTNTPSDSLTTSDIDHLADFSKTTGWPVIFGLNLGNDNIAASVDEAKYVCSKLGPNLFDLQLGNEPDYFYLGFRPKSYSVNDYQKEWSANFSAIRSQLPNSNFAGPDVSDHLDWVNSFASDNGKNVNLVDAHYYVTGPATRSDINSQTILETDTDLPSYLQDLNSTASKIGVPYRVTECNSIWGGGKDGVSNTFAGTLWALDFMWTVAENKGQGINFHGGGKLVYSPVSNSNGGWVANPVYYAMLAFKYGASGGAIVPATISNHDYECSAHACTKDGAMWVTVLNKEASKDITFTLPLKKAISDIRVYRLSAPSVASKTEVSFANSTINSDGTFDAGRVEQYTTDQKNLAIKIPAASAAVIMIN